MARCYCHWRNVLICVCIPFILFFLLLAFVTVMVCFSMTQQVKSSSGASTNGIIAQLFTAPEKNHFTAPGTYEKPGLAPLPKTFWAQQPTAVWNQLQLPVDRQYNPILMTKPTKSRHSMFESQLRLSFSKIGNLESKMKDFARLPRQMREFVTSMHRRDYPTIIEPPIKCGAGAEDEKELPLLLVAIKTEERNFANRQAIRMTWGKAGWMAGKRESGDSGEEGVGGAYIRRVFLLGRNMDDRKLDTSELLALESKHYGDILQWDFKDSFFNLTLKDVHFWSWFSRNCPQSCFVFKGDDDVFVNTQSLVNYLQDQLGKPGAYKTMRTFMVGNVISTAQPIRVNTSKYYIPDSFYKGYYPAYAGGGGVVYSGLLTKRLNYISRRVHLFPIDDVFVGMCMMRLNAYPNYNPAFLTFDFPKKKEAEPCAYHTALLVHKRSPTQIINLWLELERTQRQCWNTPLIEKETTATVKV